MIYYFTGTGNSEYVATQIGAQLNDRVISVGDAMVSGQYRYDLAEGEKIGWVFPIYSWGVPPAVLDFISKWHIDGYKKEETYCYMVAVCGDDIGCTVEMWRNALGWIKGNAAYSIQMPNNYILLPGFDVDSAEVEAQKLKKSGDRINYIVSNIKAEKDMVDVVTAGMKWIKTKLIYPLFKKYAMSDKHFRVDQTKCVKCGKCMAECPVKNIKSKDGYPEWEGNCAMCLSCIHRCPTRAIDYKKITVKKGRYYFK